MSARPRMVERDTELEEDSPPPPFSNGEKLRWERRRYLLVPFLPMGQGAPVGRRVGPAAAFMEASAFQERSALYGRPLLSLPRFWRRRGGWEKEVCRRSCPGCALEEGDMDPRYCPDPRKEFGRVSSGDNAGGRLPPQKRRRRRRRKAPSETAVIAVRSDATSIMKKARAKIPLEDFGLGGDLRLCKSLCGETLCIITGSSA